MRWLPLDDAPKLLAYAGEREMAAEALAALAARGRMIGAPVPAFALNFYSPIVEAQLRSHRKTATIRLGDKSRKYQKGMIVSVLVGARFGPRQHVFDAVIDKVEVKTLAELSPNEIEHDNPEIRRAEELAHFLGQLYNREVTRRRHRHADPLLGDQAARRVLRTFGTARRIAHRRSSSGSRSCLAALLAVDRERRRERRAAAGQRRSIAPPQLGHVVGQLGLELLEPAPRRAAARDRTRSSGRAPSAAPRAASPLPCPPRQPSPRRYDCAQGFPNELRRTVQWRSHAWPSRAARFRR